MKIPDKKTFYGLRNLGKMGNQLPSWDTLPSFELANPKKTYMLRSYQFGAPLKSHLTPYMIRKFFIPETHIISEHAPDYNLTLQAEFHKPENGVFTMRASVMKGVLHRDGLQQYGINYIDLRALALLKANCDAAAWSMLNELMEEYPTATFEITCYNHTLGHLNNNTIVWEVRDY